MVSLTSSPLGAFTGDDGLPAAGGALQLLDLSSNILAPIYNERCAYRKPRETRLCGLLVTSSVF